MSQWRRRFEVGALDADVGSRAQQLQALLARVQNTTAVHIKDLSLGELERPAPRSVYGAVRARVRFASQQRCVESDACRAELVSRCCQQLLAVRAMLASVGDGRADESSDLLLAVCRHRVRGDAAARGLSIPTCARGPLTEYICIADKVTVTGSVHCLRRCPRSSRRRFGLAARSLERKIRGVDLKAEVEPLRVLRCDGRLFPDVGRHEFALAGEAQQALKPRARRNLLH